MLAPEDIDSVVTFMFYGLNKIWQTG